MTTLTKKDEKKAQLEKDTKRAGELMVAYGKLVEDNKAVNAELNEKLKPIKAVYDDRLKSLKASIEEAEKELLEIGKRQRKTMFNVDGNWPFENGFYIHAGIETVPVFGEKRTQELDKAEDFNLGKFVRMFKDYVDVKFKIAPLKKIFLSGDSTDRKKMLAMNFDLSNIEMLSIKESKKKEPKE